MLSKRQIEEIKKVLIPNCAPFYLVLFGSFANSLERADSDIDIGILSEKCLDPYSLYLTAQELAERLQREVDLVDLATASTVMQAQIITTGVTIYCTDETKRQLFAMKTLKMYAKLNEERHEILQKIRKGDI